MGLPRRFSLLVFSFCGWFTRFEEL
jgi:hypothetical protein